jgi:hypothetical protein
MCQHTYLLVTCRVPCSAGERLHAFMDPGATAAGDAWSFDCPPGHRIVGYGGSTRIQDFEFHVRRVRFLTASFERGAG